MSDPQPIGEILTNSAATTTETLNRKARISAFLASDPVRDKENQERTRQQVQHERREKVWELITQTGRDYARATFESFTLYPGLADKQKQLAVYKALRKFCCSEKPGNLILYGSVGTGKDHLGIAALKIYIMRGVGVSWLNGVDLYLRLRETFGRASMTSEHSMLREYKNAELLLISDPLPSVGGASAHKIDALYAIVDHRSRKKLSTWVTMNVDSLREANALLGAPVFDRLAQGALTLKCQWQSYRARNRY